MAVLRVDDDTLEIDRIGTPVAGRPTLVFLHEGLGSLRQWRDFPARLAAATGCGAFSYDRAGYGASSRGRPPPWPITFLHDEAHALARVLAVAGLDDVVLIGHSDGASIALLHAASGPPGVRGVVVEAPHVFVEDLTLSTIAAARDAYARDGLRDKLARYHGGNTDDLFYGWSGAWLDPAFRAWNIEAELRSIRTPIAALQGRDDTYGTLAQLDALCEGVSGRCEPHLLDRCGHAPHRDQPDASLALMAEFIAGLTETETNPPR